MRTHIECMVHIHIFSTSPSTAPSLSFISFAALLVKVMASTFEGRHSRLSNMYAMREVKTRVLPLPAPASTSTAPCVSVTGFNCSSFSFSNISSIAHLKNGNIFRAFHV